LTDIDGPCQERLAFGVFLRFQRAAIVSALCLCLGMPWATLQSVAWATMLLKNSRQFSLTEAVSRTFDGEHPCELCKHIARAQHEPVKKAATASVIRADLFPPSPTASFTRDFTLLQYRDLSPLAVSRAEAPPSPPPRLSGRTA
jgi:hypothetical protein